MKRTTTLRLFSAITAASAALFFTSCGDKKDADGGGDDSTAEQKVDTPDSLTDELIVQMNALADAVSSAKDKATAEEAVKKMNGVSDEIDAISARLDKLETPSEEERKRLDEKMENATKPMDDKMEKVMGDLMKNEEVANIIMPALMEFGKRMSKNEAIFKRFGKDSTESEESAEDEDGE